MNSYLRSTLHYVRLAACTAFLCMIPGLLFAQKMAPAAPGSKSAEEDTVVLNPFVISAEQDDGWVASNTLVGSRTNQELVNLPLSVDAITSEFMKDLNTTTLEDAAIWVAGVNTVSLDESRNNEDRVIYRGQSVGDGNAGQSARNFFLWYSPTDNYNIERIDFNKGSNSLMFGDASPGGQATTYTKVPVLRNFASITAQYSSYDSYRVQIDVNRKLTDKLALRLNAIDREQKSYINFASTKLRAADLALAYRPFAKTIVRFEVEHGKYNRNRGENTITIQDLSAPGDGFAAISGRAYYTSDGHIILRTPNTGTIVSPAAADRLAAAGNQLSLLEGQSQVVTMRVPNAAGTAAVTTNRTLPFEGFDRSFNVLGTFDFQETPFTNVTAWISHSIGKLDLELAYNQQNQTQIRQDAPFSTIVKVDGDGRPYVEADTVQPKDLGDRTKTARLTATYPFEFGSWMRQYVVATYTLQEDFYHIFRQTLANLAVMDSGPAVPLINNRIALRAYLDSPDIYTRSFWERLRPENLPMTATFRPGYMTTTDTNNPFWAVRYQRTHSISSSGEYWGGRVHTLVGVRHDEFKRKRTVRWATDAYGNAIDPGGPHDAPEGTFDYDKQFDLKNTSLNGGLVVKIVNGLNAYGQYSESYRWQGAQDFTGKMLGPVLGVTKEVGLKGNGFRGNLFYTFAAYETDRENAQFLWAPDLLTQAALEDLINPNDLQPGQAGYVAVPTGIRNERRTVTSSEHSKGVEATLQLKRIHGVQARLTFSHNQITAARDFGAFKEYYDRALERTTAALAAGGDLSMAEDATALANMKTILDSNLNVPTITGLRSRPYNLNWLLDYEFPKQRRSNDTRIGISGQWGSEYNIAYLNGQNYKGDAAHPVGAYLIHKRKVFNQNTTFRLGANNLIDLENGDSKWRHTGVIFLNGNVPTYRYRYVSPTSWDFTVTVDF